MLTAILLLIAGIAVICVIIACNGYFVAQEFAFMSVDRAQLRNMAAAGDKKAQQALGLTKRTSFVLSGSQLGITVTGLLIGYVAQPLVGNGLGELLGDFGIDRTAAVAAGTVVALAASTVATMLFAELFPKNYTIATPMKVAMALTPSTGLFLKIFGPLINFFEFSSNSILKMVGIEPVEDIDSSATSDDLESIVDDSRISGNLDENTFMVLDRLLDFPDQDTGHAMIPRSRVDVVEPDTTLGEVRELMATNHTRYPIIDEDHNPIGVIQLYDILDTDLPDHTPVTKLMQEPVVVPELMNLPDTVDALRSSNQKLACVIDEYGGFVGIVTMEDLAEEILGDVTDEHDIEETEEITLQDATHWMVDGDTPIDEIERAIGHDLPEGDYETIAGLLISASSSLPEVGEEHVIEMEAEPEDWVEGDTAPVRKLIMRVEEVERHVPSTLALELVEEEAQDV
ncbi:membrane protein [Corynebacterium phocae]|uniref:Membrane protein n=1 Tax=Corynebacterium phocae TaxID=161895 RepID=A0A1L7D1V1_9CORY|nr:hemolysin family protein [Corynebacterium phocae]APT92109.1 membrane protein [Corynebacterium phocae]KAA8726495.1 HlyC/CorC family transporter [Corynebacterium phocae]